MLISIGAPRRSGATPRDERASSLALRRGDLERNPRHGGSLISVHRPLSSTEIKNDVLVGADQQRVRETYEENKKLRYLLGAVRAPMLIVLRKVWGTRS